MPAYAVGDNKKKTQTGFAVKHVIFIIALGMVLFHFYTAGSGVFTAVVQRSLHLGFALVLIFLLFPRAKPGKVEVALAFASALTMLYVVAYHKELAERLAQPGTLDLVFSVIATVLVLEATRRSLGLALPVIALVFLAYAFYGHLIAGLWGHAYLSPSRIMSFLYMGADGIFGTLLGITSKYVILFVIFAALLEAFGAGQFFIDLAYSVLGRVRGGPAKVAVIASAFMGTINGVAIANVAATGTFTIPLMKKTGYQANFAGAVEAVSSCGGQIMPPIMGAAAFIMADILGMPYIGIVLAAVIPAIVYFAAVYFAVDLEAAKQGLKGLPKEELPRVAEVLKKGWYLLIPVAVLLYLLAVMQSSEMRAVFWSILSLIAIDVAHELITRRTFDFRRFLQALENGAKNSLGVISACAAAGIVIGMVSLTGLGMKLSSLLIALSGGSLPVLLVLTMVASIILGMGLPTTACYVVLATLAAPALIELGVSPLAAHLFVFFFGMIAPITPPVALAAYVGAGIAQGDPVKTGFIAFRLGLASFLIPFVFVYSPALLMHGEVGQILWTAFTTLMGVYALASGLEGFGFLPLNYPLRILLIAAAVMLIIPEVFTDILGLVLVVATMLGQLYYRRQRQVSAQHSS